ncbi:hypothetical protein ACN47E_007125 [Coniothyrium glycines]
MAPAVPDQDHYVVLGVCASASYAEIRASYRHLALLHHPDKNQDSVNATLKTQQINAAWDVLQDDLKREIYDRNRSQYGFSTAASSQSTDEPLSDWDGSLSDWQKPPSYKARHKAETQAAHRLERQEWLIFERMQEERIHHSEKIIEDMKTELTALRAKVSKIEEKLANDVPYRWNLLASLSTRLSEQEKDELRREHLDCEAAITTKETRWFKEMHHCSNLKRELECRGQREKLRSGFKKMEKARDDILAREGAQAEA